MHDLDLARRVAAGQESAAEEFFTEYFSRLYRFACARLGGNEDAAEEVVQATLIRAMRKLHTYRGEAALFTWLCTLCRREIGDWLRQHQRLGMTRIVDDHPDVRRAADAVAALAASDPERDARDHELTRLVQLALDQMPARYGQVLEWKYIQGLAVDDIAARLGVGYKAAESLLTRARTAFRDGFSAIAGEWPAEGR
ncbi:MAG: sigma-70 family RNA polymerase sigma factor [Acidobacteriota bacterium]|nr:sigma-70 family RNA polymerase sigma factor [Acidobacteriota bacterium]